MSHLERLFSLRTTRSRAVLSGCLIAILIPIAMIGAFNLGGMFTSFAAQSTISFSSPVNLSADSSQAQYPWVASSGSNVYVSWTEAAHGVYIRVSNDYGATWNPPTTKPATRLSPTGGTTNYPVISANGSNVYVVWTQSLVSGGNSEVFNCGYGHGYSVREVVNAARNVTGMHFPVKEAQRREGDSPVLVADNSKIRQMLNWQPRHDDLNFIIRTAWEWEKKNKP